MTRTSQSLPAESAAVEGVLDAQPTCRLRQWDLAELVAEGTLCCVYRARPAQAAAPAAAYALKILRPRWQEDPSGIALLRREALVGRAVAHPNLVAVLGAHLSNPPYLLAMPWLEGATLEKPLAAGLLPEVPEALWFARQAAEALDALHRAGWMHGDIKPSNLMISPEGHLTVLDLGFARRRDESGSAADRCVLGTCNYLAPEWITSTLRADIRSDIYSLGVVLYEMLSGRLPFSGSTLAEVATQHRQFTPPGLRRLAPHVPEEVVRLVHQMIAKDPWRRPQTPQELIERLVALEIGTFSCRAWG